MNFKRYLVLRDKAVEELLRDLTESVRSEEPLDDLLYCAYVGDAVYSYYIRHRMALVAKYHMQIVHELVTACIQAKSQSKALLKIQPLLQADEIDIVRRARNKKVNVPRSASVDEYHNSTAFEALLGYLKLKGQEKRLQNIMDLAYRYTLEEWGTKDE